jgi:hypothetical protein
MFAQQAIIRPRRRSIWKKQRGSVAVMVGFMIIALMGMVALGSEVVFVLYKHRQMQMVADVSALSASVALATGYPSELSIEARATAAENGYVHGVDGVTVTVNHPPASGANAGNANAVQVIVSQPQTLHMVSLFGSGIFDVGASAVALVPQAWEYCMLALNPNASGALTINNNSTVANNSCGVAVNSSSRTALILNNNASVNGPVSDHGYWSLSNGAAREHLVGT